MAVHTRRKSAPAAATAGTVFGGVLRHVLGGVRTDAGHQSKQGLGYAWLCMAVERALRRAHSARRWETGAWCRGSMRTGRKSAKEIRSEEGRGGPRARYTHTHTHILFYY